MLRAVAPAISDIGAIVLLIAGLTKLGDRSRWSRLAGGIELVVATVATVALGRWALALLAVTYAVLAGVAARQARRGAECGCFGSRSSVASPAHVVVNAAIATAAAVSAALDAGPFVDRLGPGIAGGVAHLALVATGAALVVAALTSAQDVAVARRSLRRGAPAGARS